MLLLGQHDHLSTVSLAEGDTVEVVLDENASTGYMWTPENLPEGLTLTNDGTRPPDQLRPGAAGSHWFRFRAERTGHGALVLELRRPWEHGSPPAQRFELHIVAGDGEEPGGGTADR